MKQTWAAPERNKAPILEVLRRVLPARGEVLEIASGSGQHAVHFARELPQFAWQPSDFDDENLASVNAWVSEVALPNLHAPIRLNVCDREWSVPQLDAIWNANMIHIAAWEVCEGLIAGVGRYLKPGGVFVLYGPFRIGGAHTAESNERFDESLKSRNPSWGVRDMEAVVELAAKAGITFVEHVEMPANNQTLVFRRNA